MLSGLPLSHAALDPLHDGHLQNTGRGYRRRETMSTLERAIIIATEGHAGVKDKGGAPYILHPLRMMLGLSSPIRTHRRCVCEDCPKLFGSVGLATLKSYGFSNRQLPVTAFLLPRPTRFS
jgi:hypothetical protein